MECAQREIQEETGLRLAQLSPTRSQRLKGAYYYVFDFPSTTYPTPPEPHPEDQEEVEETRWVTREEMAYLNGNSGMKDFLARTNRV